MELETLPLIIDILNPTPSFGFCSRQFPPAIERIKVEMVFAFALIHHLAITRWQSFERIVAALSTFGNKHLLVEYMDMDDEMVKHLRRDTRLNLDWYNMDNFVSALKRVYRKIEIFESHPHTRKLIQCQRQ